MQLNLSASRLLQGGAGVASASAYKLFCGSNNGDDCRTPIADVVLTGASTGFLVILSRHHGERHMSVVSIGALAELVGISGGVNGGAKL